ncbi:hypothetical protein BGZ94_008881 [Podila epigama]|nr:hypothetical protein BGZ94_008881 [Podila epigama]
MKFLTIATVFAAIATVATAALPVEPVQAFVMHTDNSAIAQQHVSQDQKLHGLPAGKSYIVVFKDSAAADIIAKAEREILAFGGKIGQRYSTVLKGFSAWIPSPIVSAMSTNPFIDYIEEDGEGTAVVDERGRPMDDIFYIGYYVCSSLTKPATGAWLDGRIGKCGG